MAPGKQIHVRGDVCPATIREDSSTIKASHLVPQSVGVCPASDSEGPGKLPTDGDFVSDRLLKQLFGDDWSLPIVPQS